MSLHLERAAVKNIAKNHGLTSPPLERAPLEPDDLRDFKAWTNMLRNQSDERNRTSLYRAFCDQAFQANRGKLHAALTDLEVA